MRKRRIFLVVASLLAVLGLGGFIVSASGPDLSREEARVQLASLQGAGVLDGKVFESDIGVEGKPADIEDHLVFDKGLFVSSECQSRCDYPARPYFTRVKDGAVHFLSETRCPYKDATIRWSGSVEGDRISGQAVWTLKRWYWSVEQTFWFQGRLIDNEAMISQNIPLSGD